MDLARGNPDSYKTSNHISLFVSKKTTFRNDFKNIFPSAVSVGRHIWLKKWNSYRIHQFNNPEELSLPSVLAYLFQGFDCIVLGVDEVNQIHPKNECLEFKEIFSIVSFH